MYIKEIEPVESILSALLQSIAESSDYPDLRDRAFFYWRILSESDSALAKDLVFTALPAIKFEEQIKHSEKYYINMLKTIGKLSGIMDKNEDIFADKNDFIKRGELEVDSETFNMPAVDIVEGSNGVTKNNGEQPRKGSDLFNMSEDKVITKVKVDLKKVAPKQVMEVDLLDMDFANENAHVINDTGKNGYNVTSNIQNDFDILNDFNTITSNQTLQLENKTSNNANDEEDLFGDDNIEGEVMTKKAIVEQKLFPEETYIKKSLGGKAGGKG